MIATTDLILLDTNILVQLLRNNQVGKQLEADYKLTSRQNRCLISLVTIGEMYALAMKFGWGEQKWTTLKTLLNELVVVDLNVNGIMEEYARIDYFSEKVIKPARPMGKNDVWIAATAATIGAWLMTTDNDFDHLQSKYLQIININVQTGATVVGK